MNDPARSDASLVAAREVSMHYRPAGARAVVALDRVSLAVPAGACVVLRGASGSGKSTLLALLGGMLSPTSGEILFRGRSLTGVSDVELARVRRRMGFVFQQAMLLPRLPVWENVSYGLVPRGLSRRERHARAAELLQRLGLADLLQRRPEELSGGQAQRVAIARALAAHPDVLLLDEPTSQLDPAAAADLVALLAELHRAGRTLLVATHDPAVLPLATAVAVLDAGRLLEPASAG